MKNELKIRKEIRMKNFDYSRNGLYFITICTKDRIPYLSEIAGVGDGVFGKYGEYINKPAIKGVVDAALGVHHTDIIIKPVLKLTSIGKIVDNNINKIDELYEYVSVLKYVIMPDHIHIILFVSDFYDKSLQITESNKHSNYVSENVIGTPRAASPTKYIPYIINAMKSISTKKIGYSIWQRSYYDHIIRNEKEFLEICDYIDNNPLNWINNKFNLNKWR